MAQVNSARQNLPPNHCLLAGQLLSQPPTVLCNYPTQGHKHPCFRGGLVIVSWRWESLKVTPAHKSQWHTNYTSFKYYFTHTVDTYYCTVYTYVMLYFPVVVFFLDFSQICFWHKAFKLLLHENKWLSVTLNAAGLISAQKCS